MAKCSKHGINLKCLAGCSAHPSNWYCPECEEENKIMKVEREPCECEEWTMFRSWWRERIPSVDGKFKFCPWCGRELRVKEEERFQWLFRSSLPSREMPVLLSHLLTAEQAARAYGDRLIRRVDESGNGKG